jgi:phage gp29-like protein
MYVTERPIVDYSPRTVTRYSSFLDSFREYLTDGLTAERLATLWKDIDQGEVGDLIELNEEVANTRRQAITALEWTVEPRDDSPEAAEAAEWVESELQGLRTFRQSLKHTGRTGPSAHGRTVDDGRAVHRSRAGPSRRRRGGAG